MAEIYSAGEYTFIQDVLDAQGIAYELVNIVLNFLGDGLCAWCKRAATEGSTALDAVLNKLCLHLVASRKRIRAELDLSGPRRNSARLYYCLPCGEAFREMNKRIKLGE